MAAFARKFRSLAGIYWQEMLAYPIASMIWILTDAMLALVMPAVWLSASGGSGMFGMTSVEMVTYYLITLVLRQFIVCHLLWDIAFSIKEGMFAIQLARPFPIYWNFAAQNLAWRVGKLILFAPFLLFYLVVYNQYLGSVPLSFSFEFFLSTMLAHILSYNIAIAIAMITLWTTEFHSVFALYYFPENFLSGRVVPLAALPWWAALAGDFLPFRFTVALPTEILMGRVGSTEAWQSIGLQCLWIVGFYIIGRILFTRGIRQYTGFGN
jgi:ABC-2 type transport system permease protein